MAAWATILGVSISKIYGITACMAAIVGSVCAIRIEEDKKNKDIENMQEIVLRHDLVEKIKFIKAEDMLREEGAID